MKTYLTLLILIQSILTTAQQTLDTIYANEQMNVALFFPNPIRQGITGADHFVFSYNREKEQYFGLLQATPGTESNLLTITDDGQVYSYILKYNEELKKLNYFVSEEESIGNEKPKKIKQKPILETVIKSKNEKENRIRYFQRFSEYLLNSKLEHIAIKRRKGIQLRLQKVAYNASEVYLLIEIKNKSKIDFEIDYLNIYRINGNKKRKASYQSLQQKPVYKYNMPDIIRIGQSLRFVYVLPKFVLGDNEKLQIELQELKGNRKVVLEAKN
ncbi:conjugative transposon protein TraN [Lutibacter sp. A64]|uniref:DUF4138 domain-containing protein n=1 Tax=Lutibacter sp. A64 TaxID=2918526 RepID=UPI001F0649BE|nr:DUF4138 domain-containing protein [Lutibacter sp. A64]UMB54234.1 conjugative transposon protein TraN [Lutibacter sp. A64]